MAHMTRDNLADDSTPSEVEGETVSTQTWRDRIAFYEKEGRSKSKRSAWSQQLVDREMDHWREYCQELGTDPIEALRLAKASFCKAYLEYRMENSRIKKMKTLQAYWRRMLCNYMDNADEDIDNPATINRSQRDGRSTSRSMRDDTAGDIRDFIPTVMREKFKLNTNEKEKYAMYVQDLYAILQAHWTLDEKPCHGRFRVQMAAILLLCGATATRPQALIESSSAKGSNRALLYRHIDIMRVRDPQDPQRTTTVALVNLVNIKNSGGAGRRKRFIFRLESLPAFCIVSHILSLAIADNAFRRVYETPEDIFNLKINANKDSLKVNFKESMEDIPLFRDIERTGFSGDVSETKALPYHKCRDHLKGLGRTAGFEQSLEFYQLRRASGRMLNSEITPEERNQTMGHHGDTYQRFYMPDLIERDFQSIYFGSPSQDILIRHAARMGISRDDRAPTGLTEAQKAVLKDEMDRDEDLRRMHLQRNAYKEKIYEMGYSRLEAAKGTKIFDLYNEVRRNINRRKTQLQRAKEEQIILDFHNTIDDRDIEGQLDGETLELTASRSPILYEFRERAAIARLYSQPLDDLEDHHSTSLRVRFVNHLVQYCTYQESRQDEIVRRPNHVYDHGSSSDSDGEGLDELNKRARSGTSRLSKRRKLTEESSTESVEQLSDIPMKLAKLVCLICIGDERLSAQKRLRPFAKKDTLERHTNTHKIKGQFRLTFSCGHPACRAEITGLDHFKTHAGKVHDIWHPVARR